MKKGVAKLSVLGLTLFAGSLVFAQGVFTGLIIDAQELPFLPSAAPKIMDEDGREVYGSAYVSKEWLEKQGMAGYAKNLAEAKANPRVGGNPLVVKAIRLTGPNRRDLILSNGDALKIRDLAKNLNFLDHAKVMIVVP